MVRGFEGTFQFGWSNLPAAVAEARLVNAGGVVSVWVKGGTTGLARHLWQLDAEYSGQFDAAGITSKTFLQTETYRDRRIVTRAEFSPAGVRRLRVRTPDGGPSKWKMIDLPGVRDIVAAMFLIRSQPLATGDKVTAPVFPGDSPYLVEVTVLRGEMLNFCGTRRPALRLDFRLRKIEGSPDSPVLRPHAKFRSGTVWISDDPDRIPLRAEVQVFIGFVYGELQGLRFTGG